MSLLLNELTGFRFANNELPTAMVLRLEELLQDLETLPGEAAMTFNDTQKIGYLLQVLRHEHEWKHVHSTIQSRQIAGDITFTEACNELTVRCEASRANDLIDRPLQKVKAKVAHVEQQSLDEDATDEQVLAYISTHNKKNQPW